MSLPARRSWAGQTFQHPRAPVPGRGRQLMAAVGQYTRVLKGEDAYDSRRSLIGGEPVQVHL